MNDNIFRALQDLEAESRRVKLRREMEHKQPPVNPFAGMDESFAYGVYEGPGLAGALIDEFSWLGPLVQLSTGSTLKEMADHAVELDMMGYDPSAESELQALARFAGNMTSDPLNVLPAGWLAGGGAKAGARNLATPIPAGMGKYQRGLITYHGSPHKHSGLLDAEKIGTGEGAQAYGYGHYLAENKATGQIYQNQLRPLTEVMDLKVGGVPVYKRGQPVDYSPRQFTQNPTPRDYARASFQEDMLIDEWAFREAFNNDGIEGVKNLARQNLQERIDMAKVEWPEIVAPLEQMMKRMDDENANVVNFKPGESYLYKYDLSDEAIGNMLDWDAPLSEQPEALQEYVRLMRPENPGGGEITGQSLYRVLSTRYGDKGASKLLKEEGIPGIKYWDGGSRSAGEGTRNFVIFPGGEDLAKPLTRNDEPLGLLD